MDSMWYMEMIICVYLMIPLFSLALSKINHWYFGIPMLIVTFCSLILPDVNALLSSLGYSWSLETKLTSENVFSRYVVMLLVGYFVGHDNILSKFKTWIIAVGALLSFIFFSGIQIYFFAAEMDYVVAGGYFSLLPVLTAMLTFELVRRLKINELLEKITVILSRMSFGIYFIHICIMEGLNAVINHYINIPQLGKFIALEFVSFFGSILIIMIFKKNKWIREYLFGIK